MSDWRPIHEAADAPRARSPTPLDHFASIAVVARARGDSPSMDLCMRAPALESGEDFFFLREMHKFDTGLEADVERDLARKFFDSFPPSLGLNKQRSPTRLHDIVPAVLGALLDLKRSAGNQKSRRTRPPLAVKYPGVIKRISM